MLIDESMKTVYRPYPEVPTQFTTIIRDIDITQEDSGLYPRRTWYKGQLNHTPYTTIRNKSRIVADILCERLVQIQYIADTIEAISLLTTHFNTMICRMCACHFGREMLLRKRDLEVNMHNAVEYAFRYQRYQDGQDIECYMTRREVDEFLEVIEREALPIIQEILDSGILEIPAEPVDPIEPFPNTLYISKKLGTMVYDAERKKWIQLQYQFYDKGILEPSKIKRHMVATAKVIHDTIIAEKNKPHDDQNTVEISVTSDKPGTISFNAGKFIRLPDVKIQGLLISPSYDPTTRKISLPNTNPANSIDINLGKDIFIDPTAPNRYNSATNSIEIYLNDGTNTKPSTKVTIPMDDLIEVYTGTTTKSLRLVVSDDKSLVADLILSKSAKNRIVFNDDGIMVNLSDIATKEEVQEFIAKYNNNLDLSSIKSRLDKLEGTDEDVGSIDNLLKRAFAELIDPIETKLSSKEEVRRQQYEYIINEAKKYTDSLILWGTF